ncbi:acyl-CoA thioesterase [Maridesulfovibrio ferrireducens]|uniref:acyl-CoA thioesterase n=1 Tax=Maridesulfovibrio ferrireducens TaxID=246191 RepID=UPI001A2235A0|nr:acyl-CoA thioesterase [Maridesulfovibrio ferrireducens]MBI9112041.1 acyl-CoA thioesterase [Maridesulfovibrio ferrireducens]
MKEKKVSESRAYTTYRVLPQDTNPAGNLHGGVLLKQLDLIAATCAMRHARKPVVTASIDRMNFLRPAYVGELINLHANVNMVGKTSMEIGVRVEAENLLTGELRHTNSAYLTFVAIGEDGKPSLVPQLTLETGVDHRRNKEAVERRAVRKQELMRERNPSTD